MTTHKSDNTALNYLADCVSGTEGARALRIGAGGTSTTTTLVAPASPQTLTGAFADMGAELTNSGFSKLKIFISIDINDSKDVRLQVLGKTVTAGATYNLPYESAAGSGAVGVVGAYWEFTSDSDQLLVLEAPVAGIPFLQLQVMAGTVGASAGRVASAYAILSN